jgi:hypothetical protein
MFSALPEIAEKKHFTLEMPNILNFSFNFYFAVILLAMTYIPLFPQLYGYEYFIFLIKKKIFFLKVICLFKEKRSLEEVNKN